jgi:hypothetical protein
MWTLCTLPENEDEDGVEDEKEGDGDRTMKTKVDDKNSSFINFFCNRGSSRRGYFFHFFFKKKWV